MQQDWNFFLQYRNPFSDEEKEQLHKLWNTNKIKAFHHLVNAEASPWGKDVLQKLTEISPQLKYLHQAESLQEDISTILVEESKSISINSIKEAQAICQVFQDNPQSPKPLQYLEKPLQDLYNPKQEDKLDVAFLGEFSAGKSCLINALLGEDILPEGMVPVTCTIIKMEYGESFNIQYKNHDEITETNDVESLSKYVDQRNVSENTITEATVYYPAEILKHINIIDTPGFNSGNALHDKAAWQLILKADVVLWTFSGHQIGAWSENTKLQGIEQAQGKIIGLLNKIDRIKDGRKWKAEEVERHTKRLAKHFEEILEEVIPVSAKWMKKKDERSGEQHLRDRLLNIKSENQHKKRERKFISIAKTILAYANHTNKKKEQEQCWKNIVQKAFSEAPSAIFRYQKELEEVVFLDGEPDFFQPVFSKDIFKNFIRRAKTTGIFTNRELYRSGLSLKKRQHTKQDMSLWECASELEMLYFLSTEKVFPDFWLTFEAILKRAERYLLEESKKQSVDIDLQLIEDFVTEQIYGILKRIYKIFQYKKEQALNIKDPSVNKNRLEFEIIASPNQLQLCEKKYPHLFTKLLQARLIGPKNLFTSPERFSPFLWDILKIIQLRSKNHKAEKLISYLQFLNWSVNKSNDPQHYILEDLDLDRRYYPFVQKLIEHSPRHWLFLHKMWNSYGKTIPKASYHQGQNIFYLLLMYQPIKYEEMLISSGHILNLLKFRRKQQSNFFHPLSKQNTKIQNELKQRHESNATLDSEDIKKLHLGLDRLEKLIITPKFLSTGMDLWDESYQDTLLSLCFPLLTEQFPEKHFLSWERFFFDAGLLDKRLQCAAQYVTTYKTLPIEETEFFEHFDDKMTKDRSDYYAFPLRNIKHRPTPRERFSYIYKNFKHLDSDEGKKNGHIEDENTVLLFVVFPLAVIGLGLVIFSTITLKAYTDSLFLKLSGLVVIYAIVFYSFYEVGGLILDTIKPETWRIKNTTDKPKTMVTKYSHSSNPYRRREYNIELANTIYTPIKEIYSIMETHNVWVTQFRKILDLDNLSKPVVQQKLRSLKYVALGLLLLGMIIFFWPKSEEKSTPSQVNIAQKKTTPTQKKKSRNSQIRTTTATSQKPSPKQHKSNIPNVMVPAGLFRMGCLTEKNNHCDRDEHPSHLTEIGHNFYVMKSEVTQKLFKDIMGYNPSAFTGEYLPVENVSWYDAVLFANKLSEKEGLEPCYSILKKDIKWSNKDCKGWRLPTEAEWEYAARGSNPYMYSGSNNLEKVGWFLGNTTNHPQIVCQQQSNSYSICDMSGNVWEWVWDQYDDIYYTEKAKQNISKDPIGPSAGLARVLRGGSWLNEAHYLRVSNRRSDFASKASSDIGFRLVITQ